MAKTFPFGSGIGAVIAAVVAAVTVSAGCSLTMPIPPDVAQTMTPVTITNRGSFTGSWANEGFTMGTYQVGSVDRNAKISTGYGATAGSSITASSTTASSGYSYVFNAAGGPSRGECTTELAEKRADVVGFTREQNNSRMTCRCNGGGLQAEVDVQGPDGDWQGNAILHGYPVAARAIFKYQSGVQSPVPLGYDVRGQVALGAVELKRPGRIWLSQTLDAQSHAELACLFAGFLLFESPKQSGI